MCILDRMDTWILIAIWGSLILCILIDQHLTIKRLRKANKSLQRKIAEANKATVNAERRGRTELSCMRNYFEDEVDGLRAELVKKEMLLNQKWEVATADVCSR